MAQESRFKLVRDAARLYDSAVRRPLSQTASDVASIMAPIAAGGQHLRGAGGADPSLLRPAAAAPAAAGLAPAAPAASVERPPVAAPPPMPAASPSAALTPGSLNTFTGSNGITRAVDPAPAAAERDAPAMPDLVRPSQITAPASTAPQVRQSVDRALGAQRALALASRADAANVLNPLSADGELLRRLENTQGSYFHKGSPSARRAVADAILGQLGARNAASAAGQAAGNALLQGGVELEQGANEGAARRRLDAATFSADDAYRRRALQEEINRPTLQTDAEGNLLSVSGTQATPVTSADGSAVRLQRQVEPGQITPALLLNAYNEQVKAINEGLGTPEEKAQQIAALRADPLFAPLIAKPGAGDQQPAARPVSVQQFIQAMRQRGSKMSDAQLTDYYNKTYGK